MFEDFAQKLVGLSQSPGWQQGLNQIAALRPMTKSQAAIDASQAQTRLQEREAGIKEQQAQRELLQGQFLQQFLSGDQEAGRAYLTVGGNPNMIGASQLLGQQAMEGAASQDYMNTYGKGSTLPPIDGQLPPLGLTGGSMPPASPPPMPMPAAGQQMPPQAPMQAPPMQQPQPTVMAPEVQPPAPPIAAPAITGAITPATSDIGAAEARLRAANTARIKALQQKEAAERTGNQAFVGEASAIVLQAEAAKEQAKIEYDRAKELADKQATLAVDAANAQREREKKIEDETNNPTSDQASAAGFYDRMQNAEVNMYIPSTQGADTSSETNRLAEAIPFVGNYFTSPDYQQYKQASEDWVRAKLRKESGAVIAEDEMAREIKAYFPQPGDSQEVIAQKKEARLVAQDAIKRGGGRAADAIQKVSVVPEQLKSQGITPEKWAAFLKKKREAE